MERLPAHPISALPFDTSVVVGFVWPGYGRAQVAFPEPVALGVTPELTAVIGIQNPQRNGGRVSITYLWAPFLDAILCVHPMNTTLAIREWTSPPIRTAQ
jgi:hypothetical protein